LAFKSVPRRGLEIGGILLGTLHRNEQETIIRVEAHKTVDSEHRLGPSFLLSEADLSHFGEALANYGGSAIGVFRSHTRSGDVVPHAEDAALVKQLGDGKDAVFLILCPSLKAAALFVHQDGKFQRIREIGLAAGLPSMISPPAAREADVEKDPDVSLPPAPSTARNFSFALPVIKGRFRSLARHRSLARLHLLARNHWIIPVAVAIVGFGLGLAALLPFAGNSSSVTVNSRPQNQQPSPAPQTLQLKATREGGYLRLDWTPPSGAISRAILHIQDGAIENEKLLTLAEFNAGTILYQANNPDVTFQMDVYADQPSTSEALHVLDVHAGPDLAKPVGPDLAKPVIPVKRPAQVAVNRFTVPVPSPPMPAVAPAVQPEEPRPSSIPPPATSTSPAVEPARPAARPAEKPLARMEPPVAFHPPSVHMYAAPISGSRIEGVLGKITPFHRPKKRVIPVVLHREQPQLRGPALEQLAKSVLVKVKVWIKPAGTVERAEIVNFGEPPNFPLATASMAAARNWTFEPVVLDGNSIPSEMMLHFEFAP
jgi:hypothetical protein